MSNKEISGRVSFNEGDKRVSNRFIRVLFTSAELLERIGSSTNDGFQRVEEFHHFPYESERKSDLHPQPRHREIVNFPVTCVRRGPPAKRSETIALHLHSFLSLRRPAHRLKFPISLSLRRGR